LTLCDEAFVLFLIPLLNFVIYPLLDKNNITTVPLCRIGTTQKKYFILLLYLFYKSTVVVGMFISLLAVIVAAVVEHFRLENWNEGYEIHSSSPEIA
jgi:hypothetical protein